MPTYYEVLGLPDALREDPDLTAHTIRNAYRRALLQNHPDKATQHAVKAAAFSIDQISEAFSTLSDRKSRAEYDRGLKQKAAQHERGVKGRDVFRTGIETVDLDDLETDEVHGIWYRSCRCGDDRGFLIKESDLEEAAEDGEISVGCRGCSLWLRVLFGVMEEEPAETTNETFGDISKGEAGELSSSA
ncbi:diphthamide biosynthesis protein-like protein 4 [Stipitochalara longipes BDJ]|nr:diphthamide biosynthesis protein-like protein 4 [Stipitochalara longipes BDJ]